ncbi:uncharacterized protein LOC133326053 [Musca vetustissima]|uniref:uncharacterized protein LOC133326053 n=1 Tax=Musca vetustissima TaxID=27455 RepID=UPI002AB6FC27|nr:uncharacterized protein LOC133326053 [Musca vetustissima]
MATECPTEPDLNATKVPTICRDNEPHKTHRRKRLRRLADDNTQTTNKNVSKCKRILVFIGLFTFTVALLMGHYYTQNNSNTKQILKEFLKNYRNQYTQIIHGKQNYCDQKQVLATPSLFERIRQYGILNQEKSLQQIDVALRNESDLNAIALVGPVGVGKSLFMRAMMENFPWQENVQSYAWNAYVEDDEERLRLLRLLIDNLSDCGQNLLVIENLWPSDQAAVSIVNQLVRESIEKQQKRVVVFYVFSLNTMLSTDKYKEQQQVLDLLTDTHVINFNTFGENELKDCITREAEMTGFKLSPQHFDEIVATIEPKKSGCKNVHAKVLMYGTATTTTKSKDHL